MRKQSSSVMLQPDDNAISADVRKIKLIYDTSSMLRGRMVIRDNTSGDNEDDDIVSADASEFSESEPVMGAENEIGYLSTSYFRGMTPWTVILPLLAFIVYHIPSMLRYWGTSAPQIVQTYIKKWDNDQIGFRALLRSREKNDKIASLKTAIKEMKIKKQNQLKLLAAAKDVENSIPESTNVEKDKEKRRKATASIVQLKQNLKPLNDKEQELFEATHSEWQTKLVKSFEDKFKEDSLLNKTIRGLYAVAKTGGQYAAYLAGLSLLVYAIYPVFRIHRPDQTVSWQAMYNKKKGAFTIRRSDDTGDDASMARFVLEMDTESLEWLLISDSNEKFHSREADVKLDKNMRDVTSTLSDWKPDVTTTDNSDINSVADSFGGATNEMSTDMSSADRRRSALLVFPRQFTGGEMYDVVTTDVDHGMSFNDVTVSMPTDKTIGMPLEFFKGRISFGETYEINIAQKVSIPADVIALAAYAVRGMYVMPIGVILFLTVLLGGSVLVYYLIKALINQVFKKEQTPAEKLEEAETISALKSIRESGEYPVSTDMYVANGGGGTALTTMSTGAAGLAAWKVNRKKNKMDSEKRKKELEDETNKEEKEKKTQIDTTKKRILQLMENAKQIDKEGTDLEEKLRNIALGKNSDEQHKKLIDAFKAMFTAKDEFEHKRAAIQESTNNMAKYNQKLTTLKNEFKRKTKETTDKHEELNLALEGLKEQLENLENDDNHEKYTAKNVDDEYADTSTEAENFRKKYLEITEQETEIQKQIESIDNEKKNFQDKIDKLVQSIKDKKVQENIFKKELKNLSSVNDENNTNYIRAKEDRLKDVLKIPEYETTFNKLTEIYTKMPNRIIEAERLSARLKTLDKNEAQQFMQILKQ